MKGERLPPLVTTSPVGTPLNQAGVLGADNTTVLFGNSTVNNYPQGGWLINAGYWLDCNRRWAIQGDFFMISTAATNFSAASNGAPSWPGRSSMPPSIKTLRKSWPIQACPQARSRPTL